MSNKNLISVIMSAYNNENTIKQSLDSILNQTYKNIEILVIDDFSTDTTFEILKDYSLKFKNLKIFQNNENIGLTRSLNKLINLSSGFYIARQDADDISKNNRLEYQHKYITKNKLDFCTSRAINIKTGNSMRLITYYVPKKILVNYKNPFIHGTLLIKKNVLKEIGGYDEDFYYSQDYKLFDTLLTKRYKYKNIFKPLYYLNTINNISTNKKEIQSYYAYCVKNKLIPDGRK